MALPKHALSEDLQSLGLTHFISPLFFEYQDRMLAISFGRKGGVSEGPFASLNTSFAMTFARPHNPTPTLRVNTHPDTEANVQENREIICEALYDLGAKVENIYATNPNYGAGNQVVYADRQALDTLRTTPRPQRKVAHSVVINQPGIIPFFSTADCPIVTLYDPKKHVLAHAHVDIPGVNDQTIPLTVAMMSENLGCATQNILAAIGPSAGAWQLYERNMNRIGGADWVGCRRNEAPRFIRINLRGAITNQLRRSGIQINNIDSSAPCTVHNSDQWFSLRATSDQSGIISNIAGQHAVTGRGANLAMLLD